MLAKGLPIEIEGVAIGVDVSSIGISRIGLRGKNQKD